MAGIDKSYYIILEELKEKIRLARQKASIAINTQLLSIYWEIGDAISQHQKQEGWGAKVIDRLAADLKIEFPDFKGLSPRNLRYMKSFAEAWPDFSILQPPVAKLQGTEKHENTFVQPPVALIPWAHHIVILSKIKSKETQLFYIKKTIENGWSKSTLALEIESQLHLRQGQAITNFDHTLPQPHADLARETLKNPYVFDFLGIGAPMQERELEKALIQHIKKFMLELGRGFAYVGNQYNLVVENDDYFLDLLFYNYHLHCFIVYELKVGNFEPEFTGKLNFYINTVNDKIKGKEDKPTIGVLLCKTPNDTVVKYSLQGIQTPMGVAEYEFTKALPKELKGEMPTIEELEQEIEKEIIEFKENRNPVDARLQALKEKLRGLKTDEIQTPVSFKILQNLFANGLKPLYLKIIDKLSTEFQEEFLSQSKYWYCNGKSVGDIEEIQTFWENEENLKKIRELDFTYQLHGFKKAGTEDFGENQTLRFEFRDYWYGFTLINHNNQQPFIKKLYHQPITNEDQQQIIDLMLTKVMDRIDWILEFMKNKEKQDKL